MEEGQQRSHNTAIVVALITVFGGIGTAVVTNWEKIFGSDPAPLPAPRPAGRDDLSAGNATAREPGAADPAVQAPATPALNIAGAWTDAGGMREQFVQQGSDFRYQQFAGGLLVGEGVGLIEGRAINYRFHFNNGQIAMTGRCSGTVHGSDRIDGTCYPDGAPAFGIEMRR